MIKSFETNEFNRDLKLIYQLETEELIYNDGAERDITTDAIFDAYKQGRLFSGRDPGGGVGQGRRHVYIKNNLRHIKTYSQASWRLIEMIVKDQVDIEDLPLWKIQQLLFTILPNGSTLISELVKNNNLSHFTRLLNKVSDNREVLQIALVPDITGKTALHLCVEQEQQRAAENLLEVIGENPLGDHFDVIEDVLPALIEANPIAVCKYFNQRLISCPWFPKSTTGDLKLNDEGIDFGVISDSLVTIDQATLKNKLFNIDTTDEDHSKKEVKRLPMSLKVFDFPRMHDLDNPTANKILEALSTTDETSIFDCAYVQSLLEFQWTVARKNIIKKQFVPYMCLLFSFFYYTIFHFEDEHRYLAEHQQISPFLRMQGLFLRLLIIVLILYFMNEELKQAAGNFQMYVYEFWNYIIWVAIMLIWSSMILVAIEEAQRGNPEEMLKRQEIVEKSGEPEPLTMWQRSLNGLAFLFLAFILLE